jgi:uncharacterized protein (TIGR00299 family) protein
MRIGYLECFSGISGDMLLGAMVDAGVSFDCLERTAAALGVGARLEMRKVSRGGLAATKVDVITDEGSGVRIQGSEGTGNREQGTENKHSHEHGYSLHNHEHREHEHEHHHSAHTHAPHRSLSAIVAIIRSAPLTEAVKERAIRAFQQLGEAEAAIHSVPVEEVHFHEVGAVDTIVDIVCAAAGAEALGVERWLASPLNVGSGTVVCQHGTLPVPAPATLALLGDAPVYAAGEPMERVTPTGAVLLRMLDVRYEKLPAVRILKTGYGAGGHETHGQPNLLRLLIGEGSSDEATESIAIIETVIDDCNPQLLAYVSERLLEAGAWDVYRVSVQMKKGRSGVQMTVLCRPDLVPALQELLFRETTTIGLRWRLENKVALAREFAEVETGWGKVRIKVARLPNGIIANASPEYEDCRALATQHSVPLKQVMEEAMRAYAVTKESL